MGGVALKVHLGRGRRRFAAWLPALVLTVVAGVGVLLIGLSVAPEPIPGDTFQVKPRSAPGASSTVATSSRTIAAWAQSGTCDPPYDSDDGPPGQDAVLPPRAHLDPIGYLVILPGAVPPAPPSRIPVALGCRGPPASVTR